MRAAIIVCLALLGVRTFAAFDVYLQVTPGSGSAIAGEVVDPLYNGWIKVLAFGGGADFPASLSGTGGKAAFMPFTLSKTVDESTATFFGKLAAGSPLSTLQMVIVQRAPGRIELWNFTANSAYFTGQSFSASSGGTVAEKISFAVGKINVSYIQTSPSGDALAEIFANWNVTTNTGTMTAGTMTPSYPGGQHSNGDAITDGWMAYYFGHVLEMAADKSLSTSDADGDGLTNLAEFYAHTNPLLPSSTFRVTVEQTAGTGSYSLSWLSVPGLTYHIQTAPAPGGPFTLVKDVVSAGYGTTSTTVTVLGPPVFFRVTTP